MPLHVRTTSASMRAMPCAPNAAKNPARVNLFGVLPLSPTNHSWAGRKGFTSPFFIGCSPRANRIRGAYMVDGVLRDNVCLCVCLCVCMWQCCIWRCGVWKLFVCVWDNVNVVTVLLEEAEAEEGGGAGRMQNNTTRTPYCTIMLEIVENVCLLYRVPNLPVP